MDRKDVTPSREKRQWTTPALELKGTVGEILNHGGGKLSVTGGDPGEMRCQKPAKPPKPC